jgi:deoxyribose-phosphate aldolase
MVIQVGLVKSHLYGEVYKDILAVCEVCHRGPKYVICKVILETCLLTEDEILKVSHLAGTAGADYIKTSTGFSTSGANPAIVAKMAEIASQYPRDHRVGWSASDDVLSHTMRVKASGGIRDGGTAIKMIQAGLVRGLGTSATVAIINELRDSMEIENLEGLLWCMKSGSGTRDTPKVSVAIEQESKY